MTRAKHVMGKDLMVFLDSKALALATSCKLTVKADMQDVATKDSGMWNEQELSKLSFEGSSDALFANDKDIDHVHLTLMKAMIAGTSLEITFGVVSNPSTAGVPEGGWLAPVAGCYKGSVKITNIDFNGANGDKATMSISFVGSGELTVVEFQSGAQAMSLKTPTK